MLEFILKTFCLLILFLFLGTGIYFLSGGKCLKFFFHDLLGWHIPTDERYYAGINECSHCKVCGKPIMQDSQGNWF